MSKTVYLLNGPNLNHLGRAHESTTPEGLEAQCRSVADRHGFGLEFRQTNREGELIGWIQEARQSAGVVINPAGFAYNSISVRDALLMCECPVIEVHVSNIFSQENEPWRANSIMSAAATGVIAGLGLQGYVAALDFIGLSASEAK